MLSGAGCQLQFTGRSEGDGLCLKRVHVAERHTFFALKKKKRSEKQNRHLGTNANWRHVYLRNDSQKGVIEPSLKKWQN